MTALPAAAMVFALAGTPASAGTGIQAGPVCLPTTIHPGATAALPPVTVQDKGSGDESIALDVQKVPGPSAVFGKPVPPSWVTFTYPRKWLVFSQSSVSVASGATAAVPAHLTVPPSARLAILLRAWFFPQSVRLRLFLFQLQRPCFSARCFQWSMPPVRF